MYIPKKKKNFHLFIIIFRTAITILNFSVKLLCIFTHFHFKTSKIPYIFFKIKIQNKTFWWIFIKIAIIVIHIAQTFMPIFSKIHQHFYFYLNFKLIFFQFLIFYNRIPIFKAKMSKKVKKFDSED